ncbi:PREDICTED: peroxisomal membrane protein 2 isoform X1 [Condylura cristata]|uniref:peroxisomal membrane protein 2 isoform X1 n=1 Tax=Condylura cristata TaxID=143302 RepID=UPI000642BB0F|nr:PREDICTED: peroxisomal membrane protein 2 isoform X1 [Condylura cristata]
MAPAASKLRAAAGLGALPRRALAQYLRLLRLYPVFTKAATSGILSALGNILAEIIGKKRKKENSQKLTISGPLRYAIYGAAESLLLPVPGALGPTWGALGHTQASVAGPPALRTRLPAAVLPGHGPLGVPCAVRQHGSPVLVHVPGLSGEVKLASREAGTAGGPGRCPPEQDQRQEQPDTTSPGSRYLKVVDGKEATQQ